MRTLVLCILIIYELSNPIGIKRSDLAIDKFDVAMILSEASSECILCKEIIYHVNYNNIRQGRKPWQTFAKRKNLEQWVSKERKDAPESYEEAIQAIINFRNGLPDLSNGATLVENVDKFGWPKDWDRSKVQLTLKIHNLECYQELKTPVKERREPTSSRTMIASR